MKVWTVIVVKEYGDGTHMHLSYADSLPYSATWDDFQKEADAIINRNKENFSKAVLIFEDVVKLFIPTH